MLRNKRDKPLPNESTENQDDENAMSSDPPPLIMAHTLWNSPRERRKFMQKYRTQFSSAGATVLSTFAAVSGPLRLHEVLDSSERC
jgi:hypothetical protein